MGDGARGGKTQGSASQGVTAQSRLLLDVFDRLYSAYGPQHWWPGDGAFEVMVGAILIQSAAWTNVEKALANLKAAGVLSPEGLRRLEENDLARLIYPSGYFNSKAAKLKALVAMLFERFEGDLEEMLATPEDDLRPLLLDTHGVGPETADSILLYAAGRPAFVVDAYARRIFARLGVMPQRDAYPCWRELFMAALPEDAALFNEYHALMVHHGKDVCQNRPRCSGCVLYDICPTGQRLTDEARESGAEAIPKS
jgi:endonuclease-3 related protein